MSRFHPHGPVLPWPLCQALLGCFLVGLCQGKSASPGYCLPDRLSLWLCGYGRRHPTPAPRPGGEAERQRLPSVGETETQACANHFLYFPSDFSHPTSNHSIRKGKSDQGWDPGETPAWAGSSPGCRGCVPRPEEPCIRSMEEGAAAVAPGTLLRTQALGPALSQHPPPMCG